MVCCGKSLVEHGLFSFLALVIWLVMTLKSLQMLFKRPIGRKLEMFLGSPFLYSRIMIGSFHF